MADWSVGQKKAFAALLLIGGTAIITIFSDPMVDTLSAFAKTIGISPFYVSFLITPLVRFITRRFSFSSSHPMHMYASCYRRPMLVK
jgi:Ca2+/H+ antiporter